MVSKSDAAQWTQREANSVFQLAQLFHNVLQNLLRKELGIESAFR